MFWIYYALCTTVLGVLIAKQSLRILKYPDRYPKWVQFSFFPATTFLGDGIHEAMRKGRQRPALCCLLEIDKHLESDDNDDRIMRSIYVFLTIIFLPLRIFFFLLAMVIFGLITFLFWGIFSFVELCGRMLAKCGRFMDI